MLGLPLDIRHIAFASANFVHGLYYLSPEHLTWQVVILSFVGMLLIGMMNLLVSFSLALMVALRSKEVKFTEWKQLYKLVTNHFITRPLDFVWPRKQTVKYAKINSLGEIIFEEATDEKANHIFADSIVRRLGRNKPKDASKGEVPDDIREAIEAYHNDELDESGNLVDKSSDDYNDNGINSLPKPSTPPNLPG